MAFREFFLQRDNIYLLSIMIKLLRFSAILLCFVLVVFVMGHDALCTQREILSSRCNIWNKHGVNFITKFQASNVISYPVPVHVSLCVPPAICTISFRRLPHFEYKWLIIRGGTLEKKYMMKIMKTEERMEEIFFKTLLK